MPTKQKTIEKIKIVGETREFDYETVKKLVVKIGRHYYLKTSKDITLVADKTGKCRYYRKASPRVFKNRTGEYRLIDESVELWDGTRVWELDINLVSLYDGTRKGLIGINAIRCDKNGKYYNSDHESIITVVTPNNEMSKTKSSRRVHSLDSIEMDRHYGENIRSHAKFGVNKCSHKGTYFFDEDLKRYNGVSGNIVLVNKFDLPKLKLVPVATGIADRYEFDFNFGVVNLDKDNQTVQNIVFSELLGFYVLNEPLKKRLEESFSKMLEDNKSKTTARKGRITDDNDPLSSLDFATSEEYPKSVQMIQGDINGSEVYYHPPQVFRRQHYSQSLFKTGGKDYTFGVEHESCAGIVPNIILAQHGLTKVGDGSTRYERDERRVLHYEYVSSVLHGDIGIGKIYEYLPKIGSHILQNNKCSTHIHIGGQSDSRHSTDTPAFNRRFSAYAILLGAQVEDSLADLLPPSRNPKNNRYCSSIKRYGGKKLRSKKDIDSLVAEYVFESDTLNRDQNTASSLSRWSNSRYKWLNLVNCNTENRHRRSETFQTIEFRMFPPTIDPIKVHLWVLICQAFVWFVENRQRKIKKGNLTIQDVLREAYKDKPIWSFIQKNT